MSRDPEPEPISEGGDPPCWSHLLEDDMPDDDEIVVVSRSEPPAT
jgi:hypothetical protein